MKPIIYTYLDSILSPTSQVIPLDYLTTNDGTHNSGTSYESSSIPSVDGQFVTVYPHVHDDIGQNSPPHYCIGTSGMGNEIATTKNCRNRFWK